MEFKFLVFFSLILLLNVGCTNATYKINSKSKVHIVISEQPTRAEKLAATELSYFLKKSVGAETEIIVDKKVDTFSENVISIGNNALVEKVFGDRFVGNLKDQEYYIGRKNRMLFLVGNDKNVGGDYGIDNADVVPAKDRHLINYGKMVGDSSLESVTLELPSIYDGQGTLYAVYDFLEYELGIRFYGPHPLNIVIPKHKKISIATLEKKRSPAIKHRTGTQSYNWPIMKEQYFNKVTRAGFNYGQPDDLDQLFMRRLRVGGEKWVGNHSFSSYYDRFLRKNSSHPELFEGERPEFFAKGREGDGLSLQLCYTNEALIEQVAKDACDYFEGKPLIGHQRAIGDYFALIPMDNAAWCMCENCQIELAKDVNNVTGALFSSGLASNYLWGFVNKVAKKVKEKHPNKWISALAYHVYAYKPDFPLESNIAVAPCLHTRNSYAQGTMKNDWKFYKSWIDESKQSGRPIFLWNYLCFPTERGLISGFNVFPGFSIHNTGNEIKMYANDGVQGIFLCGIGEQLDYYIVNKLFDNPDLDIDQLIDEFFSGYFGAAGEPMKQFYLEIERVFTAPENYPVESNQTEELAWKYLGTKDVMDKLELYIEEAVKLARTELEKIRVDSWKTGVWDYMKAGKEQYELKILQ